MGFGRCLVVSIGSVTLIVIAQAIIFLTILSAFLFFLLREKNKKINALVNDAKEHNEKSPLASVEYYLKAEIKLLEGRFDLLFKDNDLLKPTFGEADWLSLRKNFLEIEKELLTEENRLEVLWDDIGDKFKSTLKDHNLVKRHNVKEIQEDDEDDVKEMKKLLKSQYDEFDSLYLDLEGEKTESEVSELKERLSGIMRNHTELTHCIYILEDETIFLHNQIKELAK